MFLVNSVNRNIAMDQLLAILEPLLFLWVGLLWLMGSKIANRLLYTDVYNEKQIKIRPYGLAKTIVTGTFFLFLVICFGFYRVWDMVMLFAAVLLGYLWIKFRTYSAHLEYTYRHLVFRTGKKQESFSWDEVSQISWMSTKVSIAYLLEIKFSSGMIAHLSSNDFVGLTKLKAFFDEKYFKD